jgi:hypothetical protein
MGNAEFPVGATRAAIVPSAGDILKIADLDLFAMRAPPIVAANVRFASGNHKCMERQRPTRAYFGIMTERSVSL